MNKTELAHIWASRNRKKGKAYNVNFVGDSIFSYGWWEMARFVDFKKETIVFMRDWSYSGYTSRHMNAVWEALRGLNVRIIRVPGNMRHDGYWGNSEVINHEGSLTEWKKRMETWNKSFLKSRNPEWVLEKIENIYRNVTEYCKLFNLKVPQGFKELLINRDDVQYFIEGKKEQAAIREAKAAERAAKQHEELLRDNKDKIAEFATHEERWMNGEKVTTYLHIYARKSSKFFEFSQTRIRIMGDMVETSRGAKAPVREAKILWERIKSGKDVKGFRIGDYLVISMNGTLKIGCHEISREEIDRFVEKYGWNA